MEFSSLLGNERTQTDIVNYTLISNNLYSVDFKNSNTHLFMSHDTPSVPQHVMLDLYMLVRHSTDLQAHDTLHCDYELEDIFGT